MTNPGLGCLVSRALFGPVSAELVCVVVTSSTPSPSPLPTTVSLHPVL